MQVNTSTSSLEYSFPSPQKEVKPEVKTAPKEVPKPKETENQPNKNEVDKAENLQKLQTTLAENDMELKFSRDVETQALIVELVNNKTGEAVLQIPSEVSLKLSAQFVKLQGQFVDEQK